MLTAAAEMYFEHGPEENSDASFELQGETEDWEYDDTYAYLLTDY